MRISNKLLDFQWILPILDIIQQNCDLGWYFQCSFLHLSAFLFDFHVNVHSLRYLWTILRAWTLYPKQANMNSTLTLLTRVTMTCEKWNILFMTAYGYSTSDLFLEILIFLLTDSMNSLWSLTALSMVSSIPLGSLPKYPLSRYTVIPYALKGQSLRHDPLLLLPRMIGWMKRDCYHQLWCGPCNRRMFYYSSFWMNHPLIFSSILPLSDHRASHVRDLMLWMLHPEQIPSSPLFLWVQAVSVIHSIWYRLQIITFQFEIPIVMLNNYLFCYKCVR